MITLNVVLFLVVVASGVLIGGVISVRATTAVLRAGERQDRIIGAFTRDRDVIDEAERSM